MTAYNAEKYIAEAIESIRAQSYANWELLVADDCSTDRTRSIIDEFAAGDERIKAFHNDENLHYLRTRNKLFRLAGGDLITFLDADDLAEKDRLKLQAEAFEKDPELGLCGCLVKYVDESKNRLAINNSKPLEYEDIKKTALEKNPCTGSAIMVRAEIIREIGGYRDFFSGIGNEDYDLVTRIIEKHRSINLPDELYVYRQLGNSTSRSATVLFDMYRQHGHELVKLFMRERAETGRDSLDRGDYPKIRNFILEKHKPYVLDPSKLYRDLAADSIYSKIYDEAVSYSKKAIVKNPFEPLNYRTLFYCLRKKLFN